MKIRFSIREMLLATVIVALLIAWWIDHRRMQHKLVQISSIGSIEGQVIYGDSGKPAGDVRVFVRGTRPVLTGSMPNYESAVTDEAGRYRFVNLAPDNYLIVAEAKDWTLKAGVCPVGAGEVVKVADLRLVKGGFIEGRVVDDDTGKPIAIAEGQRITIGVYGPARPREQGGGPVEAVVVDSKGEFQIRVPAGTNYPYVMSVLPSSVINGYEYQVEGVEVEDGKTTEIKFSIKQGMK